MSMDYNATVNLPKTDFPMRAGLPKREPEMLARWEDLDLYHEMLKRTEGRPRFILHDGPPFSNGNLHMGHALNKCIKDFINRYKSMAGYQVPYTPGWDNHGMPIESAIIKEQKLNHKAMSVSEFRTACHAYADHYVDVQREGFKRLGVIGDWENPYKTMDPKFEAQEVKVFGTMYEKGYIYKGKKPVYWCPKDETALAEAEIEYADDECQSIYVKFKVRDDHGKLGQYCDLNELYFVIWTTTTWTIPGNLAISVNGELDYVLAKQPNGEVYILAKGRMEEVQKAANLESFEILAELKGSEFELMTARHPLFDRESVILCGDHVTLDAGTGCVHTAPGHGQEDYEVCRKYDASGKTNIGIIVPVDDRGVMNAEAGPYEGLKINDANQKIFSDLLYNGALLASETIHHQYAHCWRCHSPILYRATDQWFCSVDSFKEDALRAARKVKWNPEWGAERMESMIRERADWCISRQRRWGLPIPVFYCGDCGKPVCTPETIESVSAIFGEKGSNAWFDMTAEELLPQGYACPHCGGKIAGKETDTLDGWFDSGSTHFASMMLDAPGTWPSDLYLEGGDQFRGWFQSSLLTAVAMTGESPYKNCLCHGWTVDGEGRAMHKSLGNGVDPADIINKYGADLCRLWAASADFRLDMRASENIFKQLSDKYLKIRNTARFILGNLDGFDPRTDLVPVDKMLPPDRWALSRCAAMIEKCLSSYEKYEFWSVTYAIHNFCVVDMSNIYMDIVKDRLYCEARNGPFRRAAQSALWHILNAMVRLLAPILSFTADEIWQAMPHVEGDDARHVMLNDLPTVPEEWKLSEEDALFWEDSLRLRTDVNKALELARAEKIIGKPLEARVTIHVSPEADRKTIERVSKQHFEALLIVSEAEMMEGAGAGHEGTEIPGITIEVVSSEAPKCPRCWTRSATVGSDETYPELCARCAGALKEDNK